MMVPLQIVRYGRSKIVQGGQGMDGQQIRKTVLDVVFSREGPGYFQTGGVLREASQRLHIRGDLESEQALLTFWNDLFRTGYLAWGYDLSNPEPPFCHVTIRGRRALQNLSRDPANPDGYLCHLTSKGHLNAISESYLKEALQTYNAGCFKATAVMIGAAAESIALQLRDVLTAKAGSLGRTIPKDLQDWRIKRVLDALKKELDNQKPKMQNALAQNFESYWPAFTQQVRAVRNDAGHPSSVDPVTHESVHASLLIFPELAKLSSELKDWIDTSYWRCCIKQGDDRAGILDL
jgi:hypothetical protein